MLKLMHFLHVIHLKSASYRLIWVKMCLYGVNIQVWSSFEVDIYIFQPERSCFPTVCQRDHNLSWMRPIIILLLFSTVATHILYKTIHFLGKKSQQHNKNQLIFSRTLQAYFTNHQKKHYQSAMTYTFILEQQANTLTLVFYSLNISVVIIYFCFVF